MPDLRIFTVSALEKLPNGQTRKIELSLRIEDGQVLAAIEPDDSSAGVASDVPYDCGGSTGLSA